MNDCLRADNRPIWKRILGLSKRITICQHITDQHKLIVDAMAQELSARTDLWLAERLWRLPVSQMKDLFPVEPPSDLMRRAIDARQTTTEPNTGADRVQAAALPLFARDRLLGVLQVTRESESPFTDAEIELFNCIGNQVAIVLQSAHQLAIERWRGEQLALVREVSTQIANVPDLSQLASRVTDLILHTFKYYFVALFVLDPVQQILRLEASAGPADPLTDQSRTPPLEIVQLGEGIIGHVGQTGLEIVADDVEREPTYRYVDSLPDTRTEVALPLKIGDRVLGVLDVQSDRPQDLHKVDLLVLRALAENVAVAVEHAQMYQHLHRRADQFFVIGEISRAAASILDQDALLNQVATVIHEQFAYPFVRLFTIDPVQRQVVYAAGNDHDKPLSQQGEYVFDIDNEQDIIPWVASHGETVLENDIKSDPRFRPSALRSSDILAELAVPLVFSGQVLGVLDVQSDREDAFDLDDYFMFRALSDTIAVAIRNANLYRSERWRRQVADSMREVAGLLSSDLVLEEVLDAILLQLDHALPCEVAVICLLEDEQLAIAAIRGKRTGLDVGEFPSDASLWMAQALGADQSVIRPPDSLQDPIADTLGLSNNYSAIAAPLRIGEQRLGLLYLAHQAPGRYGSEAQVIISAFANYAAVAIENARTYQASQEQALISTVMLQVAEATQSLTTLDEVLATIVRLTPMLVGIDRCAIVLWDETSATFVPAAAYGLDSTQQATFDQWQIELDQALVFEDLFLNKSPLVIHDAEADERLRKTILLSLGFESLLALPLLAQGEILGVMLIDYRDDLFAYDTVETVRNERLTIIQGIAHQAAAVIENALLREAQQQDAYVSAALLQVAQTVAGLSDLDDILSAIVRLTPILVGVERCILFLWNSDRASFSATQAYGLSREVEASLYKQRYVGGDFGLLDAVREQNDLCICNIWTSSSDPGDAEKLLPSDFASLVGYTEQKPRSLLGFPLSVKGDILGVMILEQADASGTVREKRLELITGITQQAALALQNDLLEQERMGRERLEQELQLAREIQQTFIPDRLPELPGWELAAIWRAARQVAGDFYDLVELPDGKLGVLIADVADKGMPAALFMVLTRTLLRAAAQEINSPSRVLTQVNDLLVPDAKRGMFVTAFYAVLSPETGQLVYANAGHNPPVVLRARTHKVGRLEKGGMALGVLEGMNTQDRIISVEPGDCVVFYTDGITEAMSPQGELYGFERLHQAVQQAEVHTAQEMLDAIDRSVTSHIGSASASDDITFVVLHKSPTH